MQGTPSAAAAPVVGWAAGPLGAVQAADQEIARQTAIKARAVAAFAASRPAGADRAQGERGPMSAERWAARPEVLRSVSEWATPELAIALDLTQQGAEKELARSLTLVSRLPATLAALESGVVHAGICGTCSSTSPRSPMSGCVRRWMPSCWPGWPDGTG
ncbi:hypothetical protein SAMN05660642_03953 [Geodermatophilus siccatus]|uniref:DUF222 domain-containing protein n=2 Tax=Geodermatophilus siccatus TaxID=1137991 RepID=A0A1G9YBC3_9ACTN|nr:hypothetical protein SAMN05660642_03953 [Geodermatophilus siccatus]